MFSTVFMALQDLLHILENLESLGTYMFFINLGLFSPQYYQKSVITKLCVHFSLSDASFIVV